MIGRIHAVAVLVVLAASAPLARAGNNSTASVRLSWAPDTVVTDLSLVPTGPLPLYLLISQAPDIQQLAVTLRWRSTVPDDPSYRLLPNDAVTPTCGWANDTRPSGDFQGDSSYTWSIYFSPGSEKNCVAYWFQPPEAGTPAADFYLVSVKTLDTTGDMDDVSLCGGATLLGGTVPTGTDSATYVLPMDVPVNRRTTITVLGSALADATGLSLTSASASVRATDLRAFDDYTLTAEVLVPSSLQGPMSVVLERPATGASAIGTVNATSTYATLTVERVSSPLDSILNTAAVEATAATTCEATPYAPPQDANPNCQRMICSLALCPSVFPIWGPRCAQTKRYFAYSCYFTVYIDGAPATNLPMRLDYAPQPYTGGHGHHDSARPAAYTVEAHTPVDIITELRSAVGTTDDRGRFSFYFVAPEVAGGLVLTLYSTDPERPYNPLQAPSGYFCIRQPDLTEMPATVTGAVRDAGGADNLVRHTSFHWGRADVLEALYKVAENFTQAFPEAAPLRINDISLQFGGRLDIDSTLNWRPPHCGHRQGTSVDVKFVSGIMSTTLLEWFNGGKTVTRQRSTLEAPERRFRAAIHAGNHYHLDYY